MYSRKTLGEGAEGVGVLSSFIFRFLSFVLNLPFFLSSVSFWMKRILHDPALRPLCSSLASSSTMGSLRSLHRPRCLYGSFSGAEALKQCTLSSNALRLSLCTRARCLRLGRCRRALQFRSRSGAGRDRARPRSRVGCKQQNAWKD